MATHYDVLGVRPDANPDEVRAAYRTRAREAHPDAIAAGSAARGRVQDMSAINEAWRVLSDPGRRALYDASLRERLRVGGSTSTPTNRVPDIAVPARSGTGRFPKWPFVMIGLFMIIFIVTAGALYRPSSPPGPDNLLERGSCVTLLANRDAQEVSCSGTVDAVVVTVVGFDTSCPGDTETARDRQGRGYACVQRPVTTGSGTTAD